MISNATKETIWALKENEHLKNAQIARRLGISRTKVIEVLKQPKYRNEQLLDSMKEIREEYNQSLLKSLKSDGRTNQIINKILTIVNSDETLNKELQKQGGFRNIMGAMKVIVDTTAKAISNDIEERKILVQERTLELKEKELNARLENPEAFVVPVIINDAPSKGQDEYTN